MKVSMSTHPLRAVATLLKVELIIDKKLFLAKGAGMLSC